MKALIIIPAYNEEKNLERLLIKLKKTCPEYDIVVVNDCSRDNTLNVCRKTGVDVIDLPVNLGIGGAVQSGYRYAWYKGYDAAVQVDGDGQHDPEFIPGLLNELDKGANICIGSRFIEKEGFQSTKARRIGIKYFSRLINLLTGQSITDPTSGFRVCDRKAISLFALDYPYDYPEPESIVNASKHRLRISEIPVVMNRREEGKSSISTINSIYYIIKVTIAIMITSFYQKSDREVNIQP